LSYGCVALKVLTECNERQGYIITIRLLSCWGPAKTVTSL
jgi:hypothetical protein